jgi:hypothetical protein
VELTLKKDSTFLINTCSNSATGNWNVKNDSLLLKYSNKKIFIDRLNSFKKVELGNDLGESYFIRDNYLFQEIESENSICTIKLIKN